jgi:Na+/melibiose symporter-like transporter
VVPETLRGPSFGLLLSGYFGGYSLAPSMTVILHTDGAVAWFSFLCTVVAFAVSICFIPETLPVQHNELSDLQPLEHDSPLQSIGNIDDNDLQSVNSTILINNLIWIWQTATRPLREISILSRSRTLLLVSCGSFCSAMVFSIDSTLVIYYIEESLNVQKSDIAIMTLALGITGILIQGCLIQPITSTLGDKGALILAFSCGTLHNFLYGSASTKSTIYSALIISQLTKTNIPILSSVASKEVQPNEQGRVQGALFAINAVGNAVGPILVQFIYHRTKSSHGPGSMFTYASALYAIGTVVVSFIPTTSQQSADMQENEPLLSSEENSDAIDNRNDATSSI